MNLKLKRTPGIYVVGFMASGKSTIGRLLAGRLGWNFFDIDEEIEAAEKTTISEIFDTRGEAAFRRIETGVIGTYHSSRVMLMGMFLCKSPGTRWTHHSSTAMPMLCLIPLSRLTAWINPS